ncbi:carbohydrate kinase family protein [Nocardia sp. NPDC004860]|uniref:carbohydrate kinase family protein n=1 Tax=Nocardia sp. NPDC004860 TaxID=3154557 RepID=UPI0033BB4FFE
MVRDNNDPGLASTIAVPDHAADAVCGTLMRVRKHEGLNVGRIESSEIDTRILLQLTAVRRCAHLERVEPKDALPGAIRRIADKLSVTDRVVVDAELCLGLLREIGPPGVDLDQHYGAALAQRRNSLARHWRTLHEAFGAVDIPPAPTARAVRGGRYEVPAFVALAKLLTTLSDPGGRERDAVVVIGDAVIDHILEVDHFPRPGMSMWGKDSGSRPGGKGLNRAVALARLNLDARLLAAIGDDDEGLEILHYLDSEHVDTSLIKVEALERTPVTTVVTPADGDYSSIAIKKGRTRLTSSDLELAPIRHAITCAAAVVLTFEQSDSVIEKVLEIVGAVNDSSAGSESPWVVVNVSPPRPPTQYMRDHLAVIDYLVGSSDDLARLRPDLPDGAVAEALLNDGVGTVCEIDRSQCTVHRRGLGAIEVDRFGTAVSNVAGAASAFSSALTSRLVKNARPAETADFVWATAAMATLIRRDAGAHPVESVPDGMPSEASIDEMVESTPVGDGRGPDADAATPPRRSAP